ALNDAQCLALATDRPTTAAVHPARPHSIATRPTLARAPALHCFVHRHAARLENARPTNNRLDWRHFRRCLTEFAALTPHPTLQLHTPVPAMARHPTKQTILCLTNCL